MHRIARCLACAAILAAAAVRAAEPDTESPIHGAEAGEASDAAAHAAALARFRAGIAELESELGPFDPLLGELLQTAAGVHSEAGRYDEALDLLRRALHIRRIHQGLYDLGHAPLLEQIIELDFALGDADALDRDYQHLYWLYRRNYGADDPRLVPFLEHLARQRVRAYHAAGRGGRTLHHAILADEVNDRALHIIEAHPEQLREREPEALRQAAVINYLIARDALDAMVSVHEIRAAMIAARRPIFDDDEPEMRQQIFVDAFFKGARALAAARKLAEQADDAVALAEALALEGDWHYVFRRKWDAAGHYRRAWDALVEHGAAPEQFEQVFGKPRRLKPFMPPGEEEVPVQRSWVEALIAVPDDGWPDEIRVTATFPENDPALSDRGALGIAAIPFRPRIENGRPVGSTDVPIRYYLER